MKISCVVFTFLIALLQFEINCWNGVERSKISNIGKGIQLTFENI